MKKRICTFLLLVLLLLSLSAGAFAASEGGMPLVADSAGLLTDAEYVELNDLTDELTARYGCEIIVITVPKLDGWNVEELNEAIYEQYAFGCGEEKSGVALLLSMEERDYDLLAHGYGNVAFTDYGKDKLMSSVLPYLGRNDWYGGFREFIIRCGSYLEAAENGSPVDGYGNSSGSKTGLTPGKLLVAVLAGLIAAAIVSGIQKAKMKSTALQTQADRYMDELALRREEDRFIRKTESRVRHESSSGGSRGGGTHVNSGGYSHSSGKF